MKNIIQLTKIVGLALALSLGLSYVYAWTAPTATPPTGNVAAPINTSGSDQTKTGILRVTDFVTNKITFTDGTSVATAPTPHGKQRFTTSGTFIAPPGVTEAWVTMSAGGGGGGGGGNNSNYTSPKSGGSGGAGGTFTAEPVTVNPSTSYGVTVGVGGVGGSESMAGSAGSVSSFGSLLVRAGGTGGGAGTSFYGTSGASGVQSGVGGAIYGSYGRAGVGGSPGSAGAAGSPGFVLVEW